MNEFFTQLQDQITRVWASLNTGQKVVFILAPTVLMVALIIAVYIVSRPEYVPLVSMEDPQRLSEVVEYLRTNNIDHQVVGNTILVPRDQRDRVRLQLAGQELLGPAVGPGFELFDRTRLGMTDRIFDAQYLRALQNELETTIQIGAGFDNVRVQLSIPARELFKEDQDFPKASVKIITSRMISREQVIGIQNLVAGSVPKLVAERVTVLDRNNRPLVGVTAEEEVGATLAQRRDEVRHRREAALRAKLAPLIEKIAGTEDYVLTVELELDWTEKTEKKQTLDSESQAPISEKTYEEESVSALAGGEPGVGANVQDTGIGVSPAEAPKSTISETITNYEYSRTESQTNFPIGDTVAKHIMVVLNYRKDPKTGEWGPYPQETIEALRQAITKAAGLEMSSNPGNDTLTVESIEFDRREGESEGTRYWLEQSQRMARSVLPVVALAILGLLAYLFFQRSFASRAAEQKAREETPIEPVTEARELTLAQLGLADWGDITSLPPEEQRRLKMQEHVISYAQEKPDEVASIIKSWLTGG